MYVLIADDTGEGTANLLVIGYLLLPSLPLIPNNLPSGLAMNSRINGSDLGIDGDLYLIGLCEFQSTKVRLNEYEERFN